MPIISRSELKQFHPRYNSFAEARRGQELRNATTEKKKPVVFISHSHLDEDLIQNAVDLIKTLGGEPYVDGLDIGMPAETNAQTAILIRGKIEACDRFILLASARALQSRWVPWELGYADAKKTLRKVAIFPVREDGESYPGSEYLRIYPTLRLSGAEPRIIFPGDRDSGDALRYWISHLFGVVLYGPPVPIDPTQWGKT